MGFREENDNIVSRLKKLENNKENSEEILKDINNNILKLIELQKDLLVNIKNKRFDYEYNHKEDRSTPMSINEEENIDFVPSIDDSMEVKTSTKRTVQKQETNTELPEFMKQEDK